MDITKNLTRNSDRYVCKLRCPLPSDEGEKWKMVEFDNTEEWWELKASGGSELV